MALTKRKGRIGGLQVGFQENYASPIVDFTKMIQKSFALTGNTINPRRETLQSNSRTRSGSRPANILGRRSASGNTSKEVIAADINYWLIAMGFTQGIDFSKAPLSLPTGTPVAASDVGSEGAKAISEGKVTFDFSASPKNAGSYPAQLKVTFASALAAGGKMRVVGSRRAGVAATALEAYAKTYDLDADESTTIDEFFQTISRVELTGLGAITGNATLAFVGDTTEREFTPNNSPSFQGPYVTLQSVDAGVPGIVQSAIANIARINMGGDGAATIEIEWLAAYRQLYRMINSLTDRKLAYDEAITGAALSNFAEPPLEFFTGYQGAIEYGNRLAHDGNFSAIATLPANEMTLEVNHDYTAGEGFTQTLLPKEPVQGETGKVISLSTTVDFESGDAEDDIFPIWQDIFNNDERLSTRVTMFNVDSRGKLSIVQILGRNMQINELPEFNVDGTAQVTQPVNWEAKQPTGTNNPREVEITTWT